MRTREYRKLVKMNKDQHDEVIKLFEQLSLQHRIDTDRLVRSLTKALRDANNVI